MPRMLIDGDAFFASCEQARHPQLRGRPVIVAGNTETRSVVAAASYEAKALGIMAGLPIQEARRLAPHGIFINGHPGLYLDYNLRLYKRLLTYGQPVELYSIDEFFLDHRGGYDDARSLAEDFKAWTRAELGITVSAGIAPTKVYAKLASELVKPDGLTILRPEDIPAKVRDLPVGKLCGVGRKTEEFFARRGIRTIGDLRAYPRQLLRAELGARGEWLHDAARGRDDGPVKVAPVPGKSISNEMTLPQDTADPATIRAYLCFLADTVAQRLRAEQAMARTVCLRVRYEDFTGFARAKTMARPLYLAEQILAGVDQLFAKHHRRPGSKIRRLGIGVANFLRGRGLQLPLPMGGDEERGALALARALDGIKERYGQDAIGRASMLDRTQRVFGPFAIVPGTGKRPK